MNKPFPPNKNAKELGIDTSRKFVVVVNIDEVFEKGEVLTFVKSSYDDHLVNFTNGKSEHFMYWSDLAYSPDPIQLTVDILMKWLDKVGTYDKRSVKALAKKINKI